MRVWRSALCGYLAATWLFGSLALSVSWAAKPAAEIQEQIAAGEYGPALAAAYAIVDAAGLLKYLAPSTDASLVAIHRAGREAGETGNPRSSAAIRKVSLTRLE